MKSSLQSFTAVILCIYYSVTSGYELILRQKDVGIATFSSSVRSTFLENENDPNANTFTNIGNLERTNYIDTNGYYTFKLIYIINAEALTLEWKQRSWLIDTVITGYSPINIPIEHHATDNSEFGGLGLSSYGSSFLDGDAHKHINWWNSVGTISTHNGGIPAFDRQIAVSAALYVYNSNYELVLRQKDVRSATFASAVKSTYLENDDNANANTFTNIGNLYPTNYLFDGKYRFKLIYYNLHSYTESNKVDNVESVTLEWTQTSWLIDTTITGYNVINVPTEHNADDSRDFEGLGLSSDDRSFLDGDAHKHINWWNSVGTITTIYSGIPAFDRKVAMSAELYVYKTHTCPTGYFEQIGDIGGWGAINGKGGGESVPHCQLCADLCNTESLCNSYECSVTELKCNLNRESNPTGEAYKDYAFCTKKVCPNGYFEQIGDVPGWGSINGAGGGESVSNCVDCADLCTAEALCGSYECSITELRCNLNTQSNPSQGSYTDYTFCTKEITEAIESIAIPMNHFVFADLLNIFLYLTVGLMILVFSVFIGSKAIYCITNINAHRRYSPVKVADSQLDESSDCDAFNNASN